MTKGLPILYPITRKRIIIQNCSQCPHHDFDNQVESHKWSKHWCDLLDQELTHDANEFIPKKCPLENDTISTNVFTKESLVFQKQEELVEFSCAKCHKHKKSKNIAVVANDKNILLCNGCYGEIMTKSK